MVFWVGILVGGLFAYLAIKKGFYEMWALGFNIIISIYLAVFLGPVVADIIPAGTAVYSKALTVLATAVACFLILHGISYTFITGQFSISLPKIVDVVGAGLFGFLIGFLVWSFFSLLIMTMPITENAFAEEAGFDTQAQQTSISYVSWWCGKVNRIVPSRDRKQTPQQAIGWLMKSSEPEIRVVGASEPNEPNEIKPSTAGKQ
jgi:hypothetical protein